MSEQENKDYEKMQQGDRRLLDSGQSDAHPHYHRSWFEKTCTFLGLGCMDSDKWKHRPLAELVQDSDRQCTDVPCLLFLIAVFISQIALISVASENGANVSYITHGTDYNGTLCDSNSNGGKYTAWAALDKSYKIRLCVKDCDLTQTSDEFVTQYKSDVFMKAWCLPDSKALKNATNWGFDGDSQAFSRAVSDLDTAKWVIFIAALMAIIVSFIYVFLVSILARVLVALSILFTFIGGSMLGGYLVSQGIEDRKNEETEDVGKWELAIGILIFIALGMLVLMLFWLRKRITLAFDMLNEASRAVRDMRSTVMFPVFYSLVVIAYLAFWIAIAVYLYSAKEKETDEMPENLQEYYGPTYVKVQFNKDLKDAMTYHFICLVYMVQVLLYFGFMVLAGVFADWYFSKWAPGYGHKLRGDGPAELSHAPVLESLRRVLKFHIGSLSFGAIIITPVRLFRWWLTYTQKKTAGSENPMAKCLFGLVECCLKCCECIIDKANREGFVFIAITGSNLCYASLTAIELIMSNVVRTAMIESLSHFLEIFGRVCIATITTAFCAMAMVSNSYLSDNLSSIFFPCVVIFLISYMIGALFMNVYDVAVDTIFLAYLVDETVHNGRPQFAHSELIRKGNNARKSVSRLGSV